MSLLAAWLVLASAAAHEVLGELPPGTELLEEVEHPEYLRYRLNAERSFYIEITPSRGAGTPVCQGSGADLWVRTRLDAPESFDWDPLPEVVDRACAQLALKAPEFPQAPAPASPEATGGGYTPTGEAPLLPRFKGWRPLQGVVLLWGLALVLALPRSAAAWGCGLVALAVRLGSPRTVLLGGDAAYERLLSALGHWSPNPYYGDGWPAAMGLVARLAPAVPDWVHAVNLGASALGVPLTVGLVERLGGGRVAAWGAGLLLALAPWPVRLAAMEDHFVLAALLHAAALYAACRRDGRGAVLAALSVGWLVHLRPLQEPFALGVLGLLALERRWASVGLGAALLAWRGVELLPVLQQGAGTQVVPWRHYVELRFWLRALLPNPWAADLHLHPGVTPLGLAALAAVGLVEGLARGRLRRAVVLGLGAGLAVAPVLPKLHPWADPLRFQLPATVAWAALAGFGLELVWGLGVRARVAALGALALSWGVAGREQALWAWQEEYTLLQGWADAAPEGVRVRYDASQDPNGHFGAWLNLRSAAEWVAWNTEDAPPLAEGDWLYRGTADALRAAGDPAQRCDLERLREAALSPASDGWVDFGQAPVRAELLRVGVCRE